ncbi:MAG: hypothetical protein NC080_07370 [Paraprevotella sp.]|nr:hypothetical protein [Paraprevotella sp.]
MSTVTDSGYMSGEDIRTDGIIAAARIRKGGAIAVAIANATDAISNYRKTRDIADRTLAIAEEERKHVSSVYWPRELEFLREFGNPEAVETADAYGKRFAGRFVPQVAKAFAEAVRRLKCSAARHCTSAFAQKMQALYQAQATAITNAKIMGYVLGFNYAQAWKDLNDERRRQAIGISKGLFGQAASLYNSALGSLAANTQNSVEGLNNALEAFGYAERHTINSVPTLEHFFPEDGAGTYLGLDSSANVGFTGESRVGFRDSSNVFSEMTSGLDSISQSVMNTSPSGLMDEVEPAGNYQNWIDMQKESWRNDGIIGNTNLVRNGSATYEFTDSDGDRGSITVKMSDFGFGWADKKWSSVENDAT